jgi:methylenetetrahydrofolate reductase (NADPH)
MTLPISFEFFPPKTPEGVAKLRGVRQQLYALAPEFCSVTYGAGGSTQAGTFAVVAEILAEGAQAASTSRASAPRARRCARSWPSCRPWACAPGGAAGRPAQRLRRGRRVPVRQRAGGLHPRRDGRALSPRRRLPTRCTRRPLAPGRPAGLAAKVRAGADSRSRRCSSTPTPTSASSRRRALGLHVPIVPGIMPITNSAGLLRFADSCGAEVPRWIRLRLQSLGDDVAAIKDFGAEVMARLCQRLIEGGAPALHFYTLNQAAPTLALCQRLGLGADAGRSRGVCYSTICI